MQINALSFLCVYLPYEVKNERFIFANEMIWCRILLFLDDFTVYIACGPFITSDTLSNAPLMDFLDVVVSEVPDLVIMVGITNLWTPLPESKDFASTF